MILYLYVFSLIALFSSLPIKLNKNSKYLLNLLFLLFLSIFIGLRYQVGGDWDIYLSDFENNIEYFNLFNFSYVRDFGYELISYICYYLGIGIYGLNFILAIFFVYALNKFAHEFSENYWLIFLIALPYLITVVAMGYTRQGAALSFVLISICAIKNQRIYLFCFLIILSILFHKSSVVIIPFIFISLFKFSLKNISIFLFLLLFSLAILYPEITRISAGYLSENSQYVSQGVYYRIFINILAGIIFLAFYKKIRTNSNIDKLIISVFIFNIFLLLLINNYSTLVDRLIIYFTFIQLIVFSRLHLIYPTIKNIFNLAIICLYLILYLIWLNFSYHSYAWIPYKNILIEIL